MYSQGLVSGPRFLRPFAPDEQPLAQVKEGLTVLAAGMQERLRLGRAGAEQRPQAGLHHRIVARRPLLEDHPLFKKLMVGESQPGLRVSLQPLLDA